LGTAEKGLEGEKLFAEREAQLVALLAEKDKRIAALEAYIKKLARHTFGQRSERIDPNQYVFDFVGAEIKKEEEVATPPFVQEAPDAEEPAKKEKTKGHGRRLPPREFPKERIDVLPPEAERHCAPCGMDKVRIGEEVTTKVDYVPSSIVVRETARVKMACPKCQIGVAIAPLEPAVINKGEAGEGLVAQVLVAKYAEHCPLHRQEAIFARQGLDLSRSTMCDWVKDVANAAAPVAEAVHQSILASGPVNFDDSPVKVRDDALKGRTAEGRIWTMVGKNGDVYYAFTEDRSRRGPLELFKGYTGFIQADACSSHDELFRDKSRIEVACWAHTRRYFFDARDSAPSEAAYALAVIQTLYRVEAEAREGGGDHDRTRALRQERSKPLLLAFHEWLVENERTALPKSPLGQAINYAMKQWEALNRYVEHGQLAIDNNAAERALRMVAVGRKNWLFCGSFEGGRRAAVIYTLIANCKVHGIDPFAYLRDLLRRLPTAKPGDYAALTPRAVKAAATSQAVPA
jgi:transposase